MVRRSPLRQQDVPLARSGSPARPSAFPVHQPAQSLCKGKCTLRVHPAHSRHRTRGRVGGLGGVQAYHASGRTEALSAFYPSARLRELPVCQTCTCICKRRPEQYCTTSCACPALVGPVLAQRQFAPGVHLRGLIAREVSISLAFPGLRVFIEVHPRSPKTFVWQGSDPQHHSSTAVSALLPYFFPCARASYAPSSQLTPGLVHGPVRRSCPSRRTTSSAPSRRGRSSSTSRS